MHAPAAYAHTHSLASASQLAHNPLYTTKPSPDNMGRELTKVVYKTDANEDFMVIVNPAEVRPSSRDRVRS